MDEGKIILKGTMEHVVFEGEDGFKIGSFIEENSMTPIKILWKFFQVQDQQMLRLKGHWKKRVSEALEESP